jgi:AcrR family transcriptional regulator
VPRPPDRATSRRTDRGGRPRDPEVDRRVENAALTVFGRQGWAGFSIEAVAREAGVGKASVYLRCDSGEALLTDVVSKHFAPIAAIDTGSVRSDLLELAHLLLDLYEGEHGLAARRIAVEAEVIPELAERWQRVRAAQIAATRGIVRRAVDRGELPSTAPVTLITDTLCGAAMLRPVAVPEQLRERASRSRSEHATRLVDFVLTAASHATTRPSSHPAPHAAFPQEARP